MRRRPKLPAFQRAFVRFALGLVASLLAAAYFASLAHMALVAHAACAEHGGLVHVQQAAIAGHAQRDNAPAPAASSSDAVVADEHEHCVLGVARTGEARVAAASFAVVLHEDVAAPAEPAAPHPSCERAEPPPQIALLFLSPKVSPPV